MGCSPSTSDPYAQSRSPKNISAPTPPPLAPHKAYSRGPLLHGTHCSVLWSPWRTEAPSRQSAQPSRPLLFCAMHNCRAPGVMRDVMVGALEHSKAKHLLCTVGAHPLRLQPMHAVAVRGTGRWVGAERLPRVNDSRFILLPSKAMKPPTTKPCHE